MRSKRRRRGRTWSTKCTPARHSVPIQRAVYTMEMLEQRKLLSDVSAVAVVKSINFQQDGTAAPILAGDQPYQFGAIAIETAAGAVSSASVTPPGGSASSLSEQSGDLGTYQFRAGSEFDTQAALDAAYPDGTYRLSLNTVDDGERTLSLNLAGDEYSAAPYITSYDALNGSDSAQPITVTWNSMSNGTAGDYIQFGVSDDTGGVFGNVVYESPNPNTAGALNGTATSITIPANTLQAGHQYQAWVEFIKFASHDMTDYPGVLAGGAYEVGGAVNFTTGGANHGILYVDQHATGAATGQDWIDAFTDLQSALASAIPGDTIDVAKGTYAPDAIFYDRTATFQLKDGVTIDGGFAGNMGTDPNQRDVTEFPTILSGDIGTPSDNSDNSYHVVTGSYTDSTAVLDGFTITGGYANSGTFTGGGLFNISGSPTISNCTISGNVAFLGGGIYDEDSSPAITNCAMSDNRTFESGGGICNKDSSPILTSCTITGNTARFGGGGVADYNGSSPTLVDCVISGNTANNGGGMVNYYSSPTLTHCTISYNISDGQSIGGGIQNNSSSPTLTDCTITGNTAFVGGGMYNGSGSSPILNNCIISENTATYNGGGIMDGYESSLILSNCTITGNTAGASGGGIFNEYSSPTLMQCQISGNTAAAFGGGMDNHDYSSPTLTDCTLSGNVAQSGGGGINDYYHSSPNLISCTITRNKAINEDGGGMDNYDSSPVLIDCTITDNSANYGGGVVNGYSFPTFDNCTISENTAVSGGGIGAYNSSTTLVNCTVTGNIANGTGGGGVADYHSYLNATDCIISGNSATMGGGGGVGNVYSQEDLINCIISGNKAAYGGAIYGDKSYSTLVNCTLSGNQVGNNGGAIDDINSSSAILTNCILWGDTASSGSKEIYSDAGSGVTITYSDIDQSGFTDTGDIDADPQFIRPVGTSGPTDYGDLQLQSTSPCIDVGSNAAVPAGITTDIAGNSRFVNTRDNGAIVDMGAYEYGVPIRLINHIFNFSQVAVTFSADVVASISASNLQLTPVGSTTSISPAGVSYDPSTSTATFYLPALAGGIYAVSISPSAISDANGNILSGGFAENFLLVGNNQNVVLPGADQTYTVQQWTWGTNSSLDIGSNTLIIQYTSGNDPASTLASLIDAGYAAGQWNGPGIISSATFGEPSNVTSIGSFDNGSQVTIARTWDGDTNLDGVINADDLSLMMLGQAEGGTRWQDGDFNYDNQVNADDWIKLMYALAYSNGQSLGANFSGNSSLQDSDVSAVALGTAKPLAAVFAQLPVFSDHYLDGLLDSTQAVL